MENASQLGIDAWGEFKVNATFVLQQAGFHAEQVIALGFLKLGVATFQ